jgi:dihydrofolate reductase
MSGVSERTGNRTVVGNVSLTLDGRMTGSGGDQDVDWTGPHTRSDEVREHRERLHASATTALMSGEDFETFREVWGPAVEDLTADPRDRAFARWLDAVEKIIVSSAMTEPGWRNTWVLDVDPAQVAAQLRRQRGGDVLVLSGTLISRLLAVDALDRLAIVWCPELLGGGARLFDDGLPRSRWTLTSSTVSDTGANCTTYDRVR